MVLPSKPREASFVWVDDDAPMRNQFVRFERIFDLDAVPQSFLIHLFADTRYRLRVNGEFVATGPGRFVTQHPEYDTRELACLLRPGVNTVSVEVNFFGASSFQTMPDGQPGFVAWGGAGDVSLETPGEWTARRMEAWRSDAPNFSFAQGPVEICDTRLVDGGRPVGITVLSGDRSPWGELKPYSGAGMSFSAHRPKTVELAGRIVNHERMFAIVAHDPLFEVPPEPTRPKSWTAFATWIHSPRAQSVEISCFWSDLFCNGARISINTDTPIGNHGHGILPLCEGWNLLCARFEILREFWAYCVGVPYAAELSLHGRRDLGCVLPLAVAPVLARDAIAIPDPSDQQPPEEWVLQDGCPPNLAPARVMAWDAVAPNALRNIEASRLSEMSPIVAESATWCFSFAGEFLGHVALDVEVPEGAVVDVAIDDWQAPHGGAALYRSNPYTDSADRFILRGGRQRVELFHRRGGKFLQITLRAPNGVAPLLVHDVFVRSCQSLGADRTKFSCDSQVLNWVWPVALRTLVSSTDDSYCDCPWRERGNYIGDALVDINLNFIMASDQRTARRSLGLFAQAQLPDGQLACCAPSWLRKPHEDFTLVWLLALRDYWAYTGDSSLTEESWGAVGRIWRSASWERHESGLWNACGKRLFIDWGVQGAEREGEANAVLNILRFGAAKASAALAVSLGKIAEAGMFSAEAQSVERLLLEHLWDEQEGRFRASLGSDGPALHANVLGLYFGLGDDSMRGRMLKYLEPELRDNMERATRGGECGAHLELYFFHYLLPALAENGRADLAESLIEQHYGHIRGLGDDTLPESLCHVENGRGSRCHSWSGAPAIYAARYVLGIRPSEPGNPRHLIFSPAVNGITKASGRIAHPDGWIEVAWERAPDGTFQSEMSAPHGVQIVQKTRSHLQA